MQFEDTKGRVHRDDDSSRPVSTFTPGAVLPLGQDNPDSSSSSSRPIPTGPGETLADSLTFYGSFAFLIIGTLGFLAFLAYIIKRRRVADRLRTPPKALKNDLKVAAVTYQTAVEDSKSASNKPVALPNYKGKNGAVRRALIVNSVNPSRYTNYLQAQAYTKDPKSSVKPEDETLYVAPEDLANYLEDESLFDPFKQWFDDPAKTTQSKTRNILYGFFHPYSNAGGGGERVLWAAVKATLEQSPQNVCVVYTGFDTRPEAPEFDENGEPAKKPEITNPDTILHTSSSRFGLDVDAKRVVFIYVPKRHLVDPATWPRATLIGQAYGSAVLAYEAVSRLVPDIFVDTMGYPFAYPLVSQITSVPIAAYVHYPVISNDMLSAMLKNIDAVSAAPSAPGKKVVSDAALPKPKPRGALFRWAKYLYWRLIAEVYSLAGSFVSVAVVNSTWTKNHMQKQWAWGHTPTNEDLEVLRRRTAENIKLKNAGKPVRPEPVNFGLFSDGHPVSGSKIDVVYPPCATQDLELFPINKPRSRDIVYVAQFRPEKRHELLLREFARTLEMCKPLSESKKALPRLVLIGTIRNDDDRNAVYSLRLLAHELGLKVTPESDTYSDEDAGDDVEFVLDSPWKVVTSRLAKATIGIDAMWNEHFGMVVVEYMAAGLLSVVHNSGGPKMDIIVPHENPETKEIDTPGFWFRTANEPAEKQTKDKESQTLIPFTINDKIPPLAECLFAAYTLPEPKMQHVRQFARTCCHKFSDAAFTEAWQLRVGLLQTMERKKKQERAEMGLYY